MPLLRQSKDSISAPPDGGVHPRPPGAPVLRPETQEQLAHAIKVGQQQEADATTKKELDDKKQAEDAKGLILRFYETSGKAVTATIRTTLPVKAYAETNLLERKIVFAQLVQLKQAPGIVEIRHQVRRQVYKDGFQWL